MIPPPPARWSASAAGADGLGQVAAPVGYARGAEVRLHGSQVAERFAGSQLRFAGHGAEGDRRAAREGMQRVERRLAAALEGGAARAGCAHAGGGVEQDGDPASAAQEPPDAASAHRFEEGQKRSGEDDRPENHQENLLEARAADGFPFAGQEEVDGRPADAAIPKARQEMNDDRRGHERDEPEEFRVQKVHL